MQSTPSPPGSFWARVAPWLAGAIVVLLVIVVVMAVIIRRFESNEQMLAYFRGKVFWVDQPVLQVGEIEAGAAREFTFRIKNLLTRHVEIVSCSAAEDCQVLEEFPLIVEGDATIDFRVRVTPTQAGPLHREFEIFSVPSSEIRLDLDGQVRAASPAE